jgi:regulatory protein
LAAEAAAGTHTQPAPPRAKAPAPEGIHVEMFDDGNQHGEGSGFRSRKPRKAKEQDRDVNEAPVARKRPSMPDYRDVREEQSKRDAKEQRKAARVTGRAEALAAAVASGDPAAIAAARREQEEKDKKDMNRKRPEASPYDLAMRWLKIRDRSETELRRKYREKKVDQTAVDEVIAKLKTMGMLNDKTFANAKAVGLVNRGKHGPKMIAARLAAAGVAKESIKEAVTGAMGGVDELAMAREALKKKHPAAIGTKDQKLRAKAYRFLLSRGFSGSVVGKALQVVVENEFE